ncbi:autotransporter domain-containing protein [Moellerella wisconsensis]|uniref:autotransporter family protein n=1 Tax=Moellerella wisconsensis TaxID=158849 RepID=UPI001F4D56A7|nr:autotransporter outer membrane beta-barrel domain-containing protein [Moellerella wisconsensis]UNH41679.1 autotransporter domain-containing protein [Moellerella wisconsensis]WJW81193.1 autotransporter domain-containing protein [Moellerella wisconsensis]
MKNKKLLLLNIAILSALYNSAWAAQCDPENQICETINVEEGKNAQINKDVMVSKGNAVQFNPSNTSYKAQAITNNITATEQGANAIYIAKGASFGSNINLNGAQVTSENGTAITIDGDFEKKGTGVYIRDGAVVRGNTAAIDFRNSASAFRSDVNGEIHGDILGNGHADNKINFAYQGGTANALFDGYQITGIKTIENHGVLTVQGKDRTVNWDSNYLNKDNTTLIFRLDDDTNTDETILHISGDVTFKKGSQTKLDFKGNDIENIINKDIVLLESDSKITDEGGVTVTDANAISPDASPLLEKTDSWLETTPPVISGGVTGNKLVARYGVNYQGGDKFIASAAEGGASQNALATANFVVPTVLNEFNNTRSQASNQALSLLVAAGSEANSIAALSNDMTPTADGSEIQAGLMMVQEMRGNVNQRFLRYDNQLPIEERDAGWNSWVNTLYGYGSQSQQGQVNGYNINRFGIQLGADQEINNDALIGFSLAYSYAQADADKRSHTKDISHVEFMPYAGWYSDGLFINGNANIGYFKVDSERKIGADTGWSGNTKAKGDYSGVQTGYQLNAGMNFDLDIVHIKPMLSYQYQWINIDSWEETGSALSMKTYSQRYAVNQLGGSVSLWNSYQLDYGKLTPTVNLGYYKALGNENKINQRHSLTYFNTGKETFDIVGNTVGGDVFNSEVGANLDMNSRLNVGAKLGYHRYDQFNEAVVGVTLSQRF